MCLFKGSYTAIVTPFKKDGKLDHEGLDKLTEFHLENGVTGILATGTTGESPALNWEDHISVIEYVWNKCEGNREFIAGTGSNNPRESSEATAKCYEMGVKTVLLVDPYYNGPSSLEIRREYVEPIATRFPEIQVIPYIIPGRTGTQMHPQDLALLHERHGNVNAVKEATGNMENAATIRKLCGEDFSILSGDDDRTYELMSSKEIKGDGVISIASNVAPKHIHMLVDALLNGRNDESRDLYQKLKPLFELVTVKTIEETPYGQVECKARNPLPYKTLMKILGFPSGFCRPPLGRMTHKGVQTVLETARGVHERSPEIFEPIERFFDVNLDQRLNNEKNWRGLAYEAY